MTRAPKIRNESISFLSIENFCFLIKNIISNSKVAIPNLKKASNRGDISLTTYFAAIGVKDAERVR